MMLNAFALVTYIPGPLAAFLDRLRAELVPGCTSHAHVTVLPPRPLFVEHAAAIGELHACLRGIAPFEMEADGVEMFPETSVIHLEIGAGRSDLIRLHDALGKGVLAFEEPFPYYPHITLAQGLLPEDVERTRDEARRLWAGYCGSRRFTARSVTLVQSADSDAWLDLAEYRLGGSQ
jgi:2'-5' RNA ligase